MDEHFKAEGCLYWTWWQLSYFDYFWMSVSLCFLKSSLFCPACLFRTLFLHSVCLVSPSLEILSVTIFKVKLKFSVREEETWERLSVSLTIKRPFSHSDLVLPIHELSGALPCVSGFFLAFFAAVLGFCVFSSPTSLLFVHLSYNLNIFDCTYLYCSPSLCFYIILASFLWCFRRGWRQMLVFISPSLACALNLLASLYASSQRGLVSWSIWHGGRSR